MITEMHHMEISWRESTLGGQTLWNIHLYDYWCKKKLYQIIIWIMHRIFSTWRNSIIAKITLILFYQPSIDWHNTTTVIITLTVSCQWVLHNSVSHSYNYSASHYITIPPVTLILLCLSLLCYSTNHYITILPVTFILLC